MAIYVHVSNSVCIPRAMEIKINDIAYGTVTLGWISPMYIAEYTNILSGGKITSPADIYALHLQRTSPTTNAFGG